MMGTEFFKDIWIDSILVKLDFLTKEFFGNFEKNALGSRPTLTNFWRENWNVMKKEMQRLQIKTL